MSPQASRVNPHQLGQRASHSRESKKSQSFSSTQQQLVLRLLLCSSDRPACHEESSEDRCCPHETHQDRAQYHADLVCRLWPTPSGGQLCQSSISSCYVFLHHFVKFFDFSRSDWFPCSSASTARLATSHSKEPFAKFACPCPVVDIVA